MSNKRKPLCANSRRKGARIGSRSWGTCAGGYKNTVGEGVGRILVRYGQIARNFPDVAHHPVAVIGRDAGAGKFLGRGEKGSETAAHTGGGRRHGRRGARRGSG